MSNANSIRVGRGFVEFVAERGPLYRSLREIEDRLLGFTAKAGAIMAGTGAATLWGLMPAVHAASRQAETLNAFTEVFRGANAQATALAQTLADDVGRSAASIQTISTPIGAMVKGLGLSADAAAEFAHQAAAAAIDTSSFYNQDVEDTAGRIRSALSGSSEAVDQFGINLRASALSAKLAELGYDSNLQSASELEKSLARLALIQESLARQNALGDAARTAGQFANASRSLADNVAYLQARFGQALMPVVQRITAVLSRAAKTAGDFARDHPILVQALAAIAAGGIAAGGGLLALVVAAKGVILITQAALVVNLLRLAFVNLVPAAAAATTAIGAFGAAGPAAATGISLLVAALGRLGTLAQTALLPLLTSLPLFRLVVPLVTKLGAAFTLLTGPIGITVAALAAVGVAVVTLQRRFGAFHGLIAGFASVGEAVRSSLAPAWQTLTQVWTGELLPALRQLGAAVGAVFSQIWEAATGLGAAFGGSLQTAMQAFAETLSVVAVAGVNALTGAVQVLTGALTMAYDMAAALGLVLSREEVERGQRLDRDIAKRQQQANGGPPSPSAASPAATHIAESIEDFARNVAESTKTPLERYREYMVQLEEAFRAGKITAEQRNRAADAQREELARSDKDAQRLKSVADSVQREVHTPEEAFRNRMDELAEAAAKGVLSLELLERGQQAARDKLQAHYQTLADEQRQERDRIARDAEQAKRKRDDDLRERITSRAAFQSRLAEAKGEDTFDVRLAESQALAKFGLGADAKSKAEDLLIDSVSRARDFEARAAESRESAKFGSFSRLEAAAGLGTQTVDQQLLAEAKKAHEQRVKAEASLVSILRVLRGEA